MGQAYKIIGIGCIHDLCDGVGLLGPLPKQWRMQFLEVEESDIPHPQPHYVNEETGEKTREDPRLGELPKNWIRVKKSWNRGEPRFIDHFQNIDSGEVLCSDPRLSFCALRERGTLIEGLRLI